MSNKLKETPRTGVKKLASFFKEHPVLVPPTIVAISTMIIGLVYYVKYGVFEYDVDKISNHFNFLKFNPLKWLTDISAVKESLKLYPVRTSLVLAAITFVITLMFSVKYYASRDIYKTARVNTKQMIQEEIAQNSVVIEKDESAPDKIIEVEAEASPALPKSDDLVQSETSDVITDMSIFKED